MLKFQHNISTFTETEVAYENQTLTRVRPEDIYNLRFYVIIDYMYFIILDVNSYLIMYMYILY
jgi:hypothetical protein